MINYNNFFKISVRENGMQTSDVADTNFFFVACKFFFIHYTLLHCTAKLLPKAYTTCAAPQHHKFK